MLVAIWIDCDGSFQVVQEIGIVVFDRAFDVPSALHEIDCEVIQQGRVSRRRTLGSKVLGCLNKAHTK